MDEEAQVFKFDCFIYFYFWIYLYKIYAVFYENDLCQYDKFVN